MKKIVVMFLLMNTMVFSQEFQGKAIYKTHRKFAIKMKKGDNKLQKQIHEQLKKQTQKTYVLEFTKSESIFKEEKQLSAPNPQANKSPVVITFSLGNDLLYKNIANHTYKKEVEVSGKRFLIEDKLSNENWELTSETKKIGNYTCYKATKTKEITRKSYISTDGKREETEKKETLITTVWYTPQIPVSNGPKMYSGLPGLILEVQAGKETIVCSEIVLNPKEKIKIEIPKRGKKVSQKKFNAIMEKRTQEMFERFNDRKSKKGKGNNISIKISH